MFKLINLTTSCMESFLNVQSYGRQLHINI